MNPTPNQQEHNPDNLTPEQYGAPEWRLLGKDETQQEGDEWWNEHIGWEKNPELDNGKKVYALGSDNTTCITYRRRITPNQPPDETKAETPQAVIKASHEIMLHAARRGGGGGGGGGGLNQFQVEEHIKEAVATETAALQRRVAELEAEVAQLETSLAGALRARGALYNQVESEVQRTADALRGNLTLQADLAALRNTADGLREAASVAGGKIAMAIELYADPDLVRSQVRRANADLNKSIAAYLALQPEGEK